jgi:ParB-like chromosome segregation protein Spo0J
MLNVTDEEVLLFKQEVSEFNKIESEIAEIKKKIKPYQDKIKELTKIKQEKQSEVLSFMKTNELDICNTDTGVLELKNKTVTKQITKAGIYDRLHHFFSYDTDKISHMTPEEKARFLHNYIYIENREKAETSVLKCKLQN